MADRRCLRRVEILKQIRPWIFTPVWWTVVASAGSKPSKNEGPGFFEPVWPTVVASGGSESSKIEIHGFFMSLWRSIVASRGSKSSKNEGLGTPLGPNVCPKRVVFEFGGLKRSMLSSILEPSWGRAVKLNRQPPREPQEHRKELQNGAQTPRDPRKQPKELQDGA